MLSNGVGELDESQLSTCGANYCNQLIANSSDSVKKDNVYTLAGIYLGSALLGAAIVAIFVEPLTKYDVRFQIRDQPFSSLLSVNEGFQTCRHLDLMDLLAQMALT